MALLEERMAVMEACVEELRAVIGSMNAKLTAVLVSITTAAVLLAINLLVQEFASAP